MRLCSLVKVKVKVKKTDTNKKVSDDASLLEEESLYGGKSGLDRHPYISSCQTIRDLHGEEFMRVFFNVSIYCLIWITHIKCFAVYASRDKKWPVALVLGNDIESVLEDSRSWWKRKTDQTNDECDHNIIVIIVWSFAHWKRLCFLRVAPMKLIRPNRWNWKSMEYFFPPLSPPPLPFWMSDFDRKISNA